MNEKEKKKLFIVEILTLFSCIFIFIMFYFIFKSEALNTSTNNIYDYISLTVFCVALFIMIIAFKLMNSIENIKFKLDKEKIEKFFKRDKDDIFLITDYLKKHEKTIELNRDVIKFDKNEDLTNNRNVLNAINNLIKKGYNSIGKKDNVIYFQKNYLVQQLQA